MALGAGSYPEPHDPNEQHVREFAQAKLKANNIMNELDRGEIPLRDIYNFAEKYGFEPTLFEQYETSVERTKEQEAWTEWHWAIEMSVEVTAWVGILEHRLRKGERE